MSAGSSRPGRAAGQAQLARRYRRLLLAYPAEHREAHGEEMLGVLLDAAAPGRTRPGPADAFDVLRGGLVVRARRAHAAGWGDALAVVALVMTALACVLAPAVLAIVAYGDHGPLPLAATFLPWPVVLAAGLAELRRTAAAIAAGTALAMSPAAHPLGIAVHPSGIWLTFGLAAAAATLCSPGLRRGWQVLGTARGLALLGGVGLLSLGYLAEAYRYGPGHAGPRPGSAPPALFWSAFGAGVGLLAWAVLRVRTPAARRATVLLAAPLAALALVALDSLAAFDPRLREWWVLTDGPDLAASAAAVALAGLACLLGRARSAPAGQRD